MKSLRSLSISPKCTSHLGIGLEEFEGVPLSGSSSAPRPFRLRIGGPFGYLVGLGLRDWLCRRCLCCGNPGSLELGPELEVSGRALPGVAGPAGQVKVPILVRAAFGHGILVVNVHRPVVLVRPGGDPKGFISVDEAGIEAAAVTGVVMQTESEKPEPLMVTVDRPFVFLIRDRGTETIPFLGRVVEP